MLNYEMTYRIKGDTGIVKQAIVVNCNNLDEAMDAVARSHFITKDKIEFYSSISLRHITCYQLGVN